MTNEVETSKVETSETDALPNGSMLFTNRHGKRIEMKPISVPYSWLTSLYRLQEDFEDRDNLLTIRGVLDQVIDRGLGTIRTSFKWQRIGRETKVAEKTFYRDLESILTDEGIPAEERLVLAAQAKTALESQKAAIRRTK